MLFLWALFFIRESTQDRLAPDVGEDARFSFWRQWFDYPKKYQKMPKPANQKFAGFLLLLKF